MIKNFLMVITVLLSCTALFFSLNSPSRNKTNQMVSATEARVDTVYMVLGNYARAINNQGAADSVHIEHLRSIWQVLLTPTDKGTPNYQSISRESLQKLNNEAQNEEQ